jgi:hypothetical protein
MMKRLTLPHYNWKLALAGLTAYVAIVTIVWVVHGSLPWIFLLVAGLSTCGATDVAYRLGRADVFKALDIAVSRMEQEALTAAVHHQNTRHEVGYWPPVSAPQPPVNRGTNYFVQASAGEAFPWADYGPCRCDYLGGMCSYCLSLEEK